MHIFTFFAPKREKRHFLSEIASPPAIYNVISRSHSNRCSQILCQNVCKEYSHSYWKRQVEIIICLGKIQDIPPRPPPPPPPLYARWLKCPYIDLPMLFIVYLSVAVTTLWKPVIAENIMEISSTTGILLDPVYNIKAVRGMLTQMKNNPGRFKGCRILYIHTGMCHVTVHGCSAQLKM